MAITNHAVISNKVNSQAIKSEVLCRKVKEILLAVSSIYCRHYASEMRAAVTASEAYGCTASGYRELHPDWLPLPKLQPERLFTISIQAH